MRLPHVVAACAYISLRHLPDPLLPAAVGFHPIKRMGFPTHIHLRHNLSSVLYVTLWLIKILCFFSFRIAPSASFRHYILWFEDICRFIVKTFLILSKSFHYN